MSTTDGVAPHKLRLAVVRDFREEGWPSMDLAADMLMEQLATDATLSVEDIAPRYRHLLTKLPSLSQRGVAHNVDRLWNRFVTLPRAVRAARERCDAFHIVDHSHAHLVHSLPAERTGVYCHDLDTFRCLLEPEKETRPLWFRLMARRILSGLRKAAIVIHNSRATGEELLRWKLVEPAKLKWVPLGVAPEFSSQQLNETKMTELRAVIGEAPFLLHVGSCIPRKRIDFLLDLFARLRIDDPRLLLVKAGDAWTEAQAAQIARLGIGDSIRHFGKLTRLRLSDVVRGAAAVVIPSAAEGFGLPVIESLACGVPVVASDLATLREAGGDAATYAPVGDLEAWVAAVTEAMGKRHDAVERRRRLDWASQFSWERHARTIADTYRELLATR